MWPNATDKICIAFENEGTIAPNCYSSRILAIQLQLYNSTHQPYSSFPPAPLPGVRNHKKKIWKLIMFVFLGEEKRQPGGTLLCLVFHPCQSHTLGLSPVKRFSLKWIWIFESVSPWSHSLLHSCWQAWSHPWSGNHPCFCRKNLYWTKKHPILDF